MLDLATKFSQSFGEPSKQHVRPIPKADDPTYESYMGDWQTMLKPFYAPGIGFNTIKSGLAVDYPIFQPKADRQFNRFCTKFKKRNSNLVDIGDAEIWGEYLTGTISPGATGTPGQNQGISLSMWLRFYKDPSDTAFQERRWSLKVWYIPKWSAL
jgi:hypothetical protein